MYPRTSWPQHIRALDWPQGDHILICGPTKCGKSSLMESLIERRGHVVVFVSKTKDPTFEDGFRGWKVIRKWGQQHPSDKRLLLWPKTQGVGLKAKVHILRETFGEALDKIDAEGNRCVVIDEMHFAASSEFLNLGSEIALLHHQGRSAGISMVNLSQRPSWIPKVIYSSVAHAYIARTKDEDDLKRLAALGGVDKRELAANVLALPGRHDYVHVPTQAEGFPAIINLRR